VALCDEKRLIAGKSRPYEKGRTDAIDKLILSCLKKGKIRLDQVDCFGVGRGPGSFTGLRIGLSTIKGFSYAFNKPCLVFSSLDAIAFNADPLCNKKVCVVVDARRENVYSRFYEADSLNFRRTSKDLLIKSDEWKKRLVAKSMKDLYFLGDGLKLYQKDLKDRARDFKFFKEALWYPTPESLAKLTQQIARTEKPIDSFQVTPVYLYEKDCQVSPVLKC
jgi:tRNA threonylcarbamoyladenosine biosynthesis protein TsaB